MGSTSVPSDIAAYMAAGVGVNSLPGVGTSIAVSRGTKRAHQSAGEYALEGASRALAGGSRGNFEFALGRAFPRSIFGTPAFLHTGDSNDAASQYETTFAAVMARPDKGPFATRYDDFEPLFTCVTDVRAEDRGFTTCASLPKLNALLELSAAVYKTAPAAGAKASPRHMYAAQLVPSAYEFSRTWKPFGVVASPPEPVRFNPAGRFGPQEMLVQAAIAGRAVVHNLFGTSVRPGDRVGYMVSEYANPYTGFLTPGGGVLAMRSASGFGVERLLQVRGVSDRDAGDFTASTSTSAFEPLDTDGAYLRRGVRIAQSNRIVEYDEFTDNVRIVEVAAAEGMQEAREGADEVIVTMLEQPHFMPLGTVLHNMGGDATRAELDLAHRITAKMQALGQLEILLNIA